MKGLQSILNNYFMYKIIELQGRVATDLENLEKSGNLKETSVSQGICDRIPKVRGS